MESSSFYEHTAGASVGKTYLHRLEFLDLILGPSFRIVFRLYLFFAIALPSVNVSGVYFKLPSYALLLPSALYVFLRQRPIRMLGVGLLLAFPLGFLHGLLKHRSMGLKLGAVCANTPTLWCV